MEENLLFRMNFILQENAGTTLESNLVKFVECILLNNENAVSVETINKQIESEYQLEFSVDEIEKAIKNKGKHIIIENGMYSLEPKYRNTIRLNPSITDELRKYTSDAIVDLNLDVKETYYLNLIKKYIYFCFNANRETLLALINHEEINSDEKNGFNNDEIKLINCFLQWNNEAKNECITKIISYCYVYCSLTVKKDNLLSNKLFRGKRFLLDANIVFRLAGINNDSRKLTIASFAKKCKELGIELCYTDETLDEIYRVITTKIKWIMGVTGGTEPIDLSEFDQNENDFYKLYRIWCADSTHDYSDYVGFQKHLLTRVTDVLDKLKRVNSENYEVTDNKKFDDYYKSLEEYKSSHTNKKQSKSSLRTDVNNLMHILRLRKKSRDDLWSVAEFLISADQNLIGWSRDVIKGVPVIVLPSVWLTIMLRFTGRQTTPDDYKAFCSFLELRQHITPSELDVYSLVEKMAVKTNNNMVKHKIVEEVFANKEEYSLDNSNGYDEIIDRAFDKVMVEFQENQMELVAKLEAAEEEDKKNKDLLKEQKKLDDLKRIQSLIDKDIEKHFRIRKLLYSKKDMLGFFAVIGIMVLFVATLMKRWFLYSMLTYLLKEDLELSNIVGILSILTFAIGALAVYAKIFIEGLVSEKQIHKYREKRNKYYEDIFNG